MQFVYWVWNVTKDWILILHLTYSVLSASASKSDMSEDVDVVDDSGGSPVDVKTPTAGTVGSGRSTTTTYRYSKKKTPIVHLEKLNVVTDSNGMRTCVYYVLMETTILYFIYYLFGISH